MESTKLATSVRKLIKILVPLGAFAACGKFIIASETAFFLASRSKLVLIEETSTTAFLGSKLVIISEQTVARTLSIELRILFDLACFLASECKWVFIRKVRLSILFYSEKTSHLGFLFPFSNGFTEARQLVFLVNVYLS